MDSSGHTCEIVQNHYEQYQEYRKQHPEATAAKAYYYSLSPGDALAYDITNMRQIYQSQGLYSEIRPKLQEYIKQYKELMPELFDK